jgi:drug/metabolite transporter (DMT)-like permease
MVTHAHPLVGPPRREVLLGVVLVLLASVGFGSVSVLAKLVYERGGTPEAVLPLRYAFAVLALAVPFARTQRVSDAAAGLPLGALLAAGLLNVSGNVAYWIAIDRDAVSRVVPLVYCFPIIVAAIAAGLGRERLRAGVVVAAGLGIGGAALVVGGGGGGSADAFGVVLALTAAFSSALFFFAAASALRRAGWLPVAFAIACMSTLGTAALGLLVGGSLPHQGSGWLLLVAAGTVCTALPYWLWLVGLRLIGETRTALLAVVEPAVAVLLALLVLGERLELHQAIGVALVLASVAIPGLRRSRQPS